MQVISINVGLPREVEWRDQIVRTSIFNGKTAILFVSNGRSR